MSYEMHVESQRFYTKKGDIYFNNFYDVGSRLKG